MDADTERDLVTKAQSGDFSARDALYQQFEPLLNSVARSIVSAGMELDDVKQHAYLEFVYILNRFDISQNVRLMTYLFWSIRRRLYSIAQQGGLIRVPRASKHLASPAVLRHRLTSLDAPLRPDSLTRACDILPSQIHDQQVLNIESRDELIQLKHHISQLHKREQQILNKRLLGQTHQQIADELGVSKQRIHQIESRAISKLKNSISSIDGT